MLTHLTSRGTSTVSNPMDFVTDIDIFQRHSSICGFANKVDGCSVHDGFYRAMEDASIIVGPVVVAAVAEFPDYRVATTGHSLGGAVAALLGTDLRNNGLVVDIVSGCLSRRMI